MNFFQHDFCSLFQGFSNHYSHYSFGSTIWEFQIHFHLCAFWYFMTKLEYASYFHPMYTSNCSSHELSNLFQPSLGLPHACTGPCTSKFKLRLNPNKCTFGVRSGKLLGFIVSEKGIEVDPAKFKAIQEMPEPKTEKAGSWVLREIELYCKARTTNL